jgi:hypothetical protein
MDDLIFFILIVTNNFNLIIHYLNIFKTLIKNQKCHQSSNTRIQKIYCKLIMFIALEKKTNRKK